jgi:endonuclease YncB( thermonuclease family)
MAMALASAFLAKQASIEVLGRPKILDGDSLVLNGQEIRLFGIDAPEYTQTCMRKEGGVFDCGKQSRRHLQTMTRSQSLTCDGWEYDKYERLLAVCYLGDLEINRQMVLDGWAISFGDYEEAETTARTGKSGIWAGDFQNPADWRRKARQEHSKGFLASVYEII